MRKDPWAVWPRFAVDFRELPFPCPSLAPLFGSYFRAAFGHSVLTANLSLQLIDTSKVLPATSDYA